MTFRLNSSSKKKDARSKKTKTITCSLPSSGRRSINKQKALSRTRRKNQARTKRLPEMQPMDRSGGKKFKILRRNKALVSNRFVKRCLIQLIGNMVLGA